jgi:hypothetical protein
MGQGTCGVTYPKKRNPATGAMVLQFIESRIDDEGYLSGKGGKGYIVCLGL